MAKPTLKRIPSDECEVTIDGQDYKVHEGEWIDVIPVVQVADMAIFKELNGLRPQLEAVQGEPNQRALEVEIMAKALGMAIDHIAPRIVAWNWTDMGGNPMPSPREDPSVLQRLTLEEVLYLVDAIQGPGPAAEKNGSRPSPTTSWDTAPQLSQA